MLIKSYNLSMQIQANFPDIFIIIGKELYQSNKIIEKIKSIWCEKHAKYQEIQRLIINCPSDWLLIEESVNNYSLFSTNMLLDVRFDKKKLDPIGKEFLVNYLKKPNPNALLLIRAPELAQKELSIINRPRVNILVFYPPSKMTVILWIQEYFKKISPNFDKQIPDLIYQYNEGNILNIANVLNILELILEPNQDLTLQEVKSQLINQSQYSIFELADFLLKGDCIKSCLFIRKSLVDKVEPTLVLWIITQEIRLLMQLILGYKKNKSFTDLAHELKIWPKRVHLYQDAIKKYNYDFLSGLHQKCFKLDKQIKTSDATQIWQSFELMALSLCKGELVGNGA